jgi:hypothetical protein
MTIDVQVLDLASSFAALALAPDEAVDQIVQLVGLLQHGDGNRYGFSR